MVSTLFQSLSSLYLGCIKLTENDELVDVSFQESELAAFFYTVKGLGSNFYEIAGKLFGQENAEQLKKNIAEKRPQILDCQAKGEQDVPRFLKLILLFDEHFTYIAIQNAEREKRLEFALAKEQHLVKDIVENNPYPIAFYNKEGHYWKGNKKHFEIHGAVPPPEFSIFDDRLAKTLPVWDDYIKGLRSGVVFQVPEMWYNANIVGPKAPDRNACFKTVIVPIKDAMDQTEGWVYLYEDLTALRLTEKKLEELRGELGQRVTNRTIQLEQSETKYRKAANRAICFRGLFTHDVNNMFQTIGNAIEMCNMIRTKGLEAGKLQEYFDLINKQLERGKRIVKRIDGLEELNKTEMKSEPVDIDKILVNAIEFVGKSFPDKKIINKIHNNYGQIFALANETLVDIVENILINAVHYNETSPVRVDIIVKEQVDDQKSFVRMEFQDNGVGVPDARKAEIFKPGNKQPNSKGMGIGLSHITSLLTLHNGKIWVEDKVNGDYRKGSNFIIQLPKINVPV